MEKYFEERWKRFMPLTTRAVAPQGEILERLKSTQRDDINLHLNLTVLIALLEKKGIITREEFNDLRHEIIARFKSENPDFPDIFSEE